MALFYPDILQSNNPNAYGIIKSVEAVGHKRVQTLNDLYTIPDSILSESGNNTNNDAIGQLWYVTEQNKHYQLIDWNNRKQLSGWSEYSSGSSDYNDLENKPDLSKYLDKTTTTGQNVSSPVYFVDEGLLVGIEPSSGSFFASDSSRDKQSTVTYQYVSVRQGDQLSTLYSTGIKIANKTDQDLLTANNSTTRLKTINSQSILGEGNIEIETPEGGITDAPKDGNTYGRKDGTWTTIGTPVATTSTIGGIKLGYTETDNNYPLELDDNNQAYVTVPIDLVYEEFEGIIESLNAAQFTILSQEEYNQLDSKDENTIYFIR